MLFHFKSNKCTHPHTHTHAHLTHIQIQLIHFLLFLLSIHFEFYCVLKMIKKKIRNQRKKVNKENLRWKKYSQKNRKDQKYEKIFLSFCFKHLPRIFVNSTFYLVIFIVFLAFHLCSSLVSSSPFCLKVYFHV